MSAGIAGDYSRLVTDDGNSRIDQEGRVQSASFNSGSSYTIADDAVLAIDINDTVQRARVDGSTASLLTASFTVTVSGTAPSSGGGMFNVRTGTSTAITKWGGETSTVGLTISGVPTGTSGTDTQLTVYASDNGRLYLENRRGFTIVVQLAFLAMGDNKVPYFA